MDEGKSGLAVKRLGKTIDTCKFMRHTDSINSVSIIVG